ncbi:hypothetical protein V491_03298 [Pseudogymnoascus sp. VKM F-3775]|nr:hypothetical protein V491_03298 [Pseudogymnoascus sp. VKM F-3775]
MPTTTTITTTEPHRDIRKPHHHASAAAGNRFEHSAGHAVYPVPPLAQPPRAEGAIIKSRGPIPSLCQRSAA